VSSQFRKGETTFKCGECGRLTRHTGVQSVGSESCPECYELAGIYNDYQDGTDMSAYADTIRSLTKTIVERGGKLGGDWRELLAAFSSDRSK
jgi:phage FluMu protein Com